MATHNIDEADEVVDAMAEWSSCMHQKGWPDLDHPMDAWHKVSEFVLLITSDPLSEEYQADIEAARESEIELATADIDCLNQSSVNELRKDAHAEIVAEKFVEMEVNHNSYFDQADEFLKTGQQILEDGIDWLLIEGSFFGC